MKKAVSVIVLFVLLFSFSLSALADDDIKFTPTLTNSLNDSSIAPDSSWTDTGYNRALATFLLILDVCNADASIDTSSIKWVDSYVGSTDVLLNITIPYGDDKLLVIMYSPLSSGYALLDWEYPDTLSEYYIEKVYKDNNASFYKNNVTDLIEVLGDLADIMNG